MGASRTRQTRAIVSYKLDSSSEDSDDNVSFTVPRSRKFDSFGGSNGEFEAGNGKGRRTLALKKRKVQDRGEAREEEGAYTGYLDQNGVRQRGDASAYRSPSIVPGGSKPTVRNSPPETSTTAFQHLVDVAFEATDMRLGDIGGAVEDERQMQLSAAGEVSAHQPPELEKSNSPQGNDQEVKLAAERTPIKGEEKSPTNTVKQHPKKSKNDQVNSDDDDWLQDDVVDGDSAASASDFSTEDVSDSDVDIEKPARKRQSAKSVAKKPQLSAPRTSVTKGRRTKSGAAERKSSGNNGVIDEKMKTPTRPLGRPRKTVDSSAPSVRNSLEGTGARPCIQRLHPVKVRLKIASKEANSDGSPCGSSGGSLAELIPANVPHRRVLGLSRRCRPPPLHPYLAGT